MLHPNVMFCLRQTLQAGCPTTPPTNCTCRMDYVAPDPDGVTLRPVTTINCSYRGLFDLPEKLPAVTTTLLLKGNQVLFLSDSRIVWVI